MRQVLFAGETGSGPAAWILGKLRAQAPDRSAIRWRGTTLSYREVWHAAESIAAELIRKGAGPDTPVGVFLERSPEMVIAWLGIWRAGAAYVPLDPAYPAARIAFMARDTGAPFILTNRALAPAAPSGVRCLLMEDVRPLAPGETVPFPETAPDSLACILYTSGSTGNPNGVEVPHRAIIRLLFECLYIELDSTDVLALLSAISFDAATLEVWGALLHGGTLVIPDEPAVSPRSIAELLPRHGVTAGFLTVSLFNTLVDESPDSLRSFRTLIAGGEALSVKHTCLALERLPGTRIVNGYGPTEATTFACYYEVPRDFPSTAASVPIGWPIGNTDLRILAPGGLDLVEPGETGELCIGGPGVALGYRNRPELTARKFIADPLAPSSRIYRTGDLVRALPSGALEFLGRADHQVKIRGHRIELGEIEAALQKHPAVRSACAGTRRNANGELEIFAWVAADPPPPVRAFREWIRRELPAYLVPAAIGIAAELPLTAHGKIDRAILAATPIDNVAEAVPPRDSREAALLSLLGQVLGHSGFGVTDHLLDIGGNSLAGMRFVALALDREGLSIPLGAFLASPTIETAARLAVPGDATVIPRVDATHLPAHPAQELYWQMDRFYPDVAAYSVPLTLTFRGDLVPAALAEALSTVLARHDTFWTRFESTARGLEQVIGEPRPITLSVEAVTREDLDARIRAEAVKRFDLEAGPVFRALLFRLDARCHVLLFNVHHAAFDGSSLSILIEELEVCYRAAINQRAPDLEPATVRWRDYSAWYAERFSRGTYAADLAYWQSVLEGATEQLEIAGAGSVASPRRGARHAFEISASLDSRVRAAARGWGVSPMALYAAVYAALLRRYSGQDHFCIGVPASIREHPEMWRLVGVLVNAVVLRFSVGEGAELRQIARSVHAQVGEGLGHQGAPVNRAVQRPLFSVLFNYRDASPSEARFADLGLEVAEVDNGASKALLMLSLTAVPGRGVTAFLEHSAELAAFAPGMVAHFAALLEAALAAPATPVDRLPMLGPDETARILARRGPALDPPAATIVEWIRQTADRQPDRVAIRASGESLTYGELIDHADRATAWIRHRVNGSDPRIAVQLSRSLNLVPCLLGVLGAGAAYVPLDPALPEARLRLILEDSQPALVIEDRHVPEILETPPQTPSALSGSSTAYVIYTSGSTGRPKGVEVLHSGLVNVIVSFLVEPGFSASDTMAAITAASFDISGLEFFLPLCAGGSILMLTSAQVKDGPAAAAILDREKPSVVQTTPSYFSMLTGCGWTGHGGLRAWCGGEPLPRPLADDLLHRAAEVWNVYGPTETTIWSTVSRVEAAGPISIGHAVANTSLLVLDPADELVPDGIRGELWIGGAGVARGYLGAPDLTASRFLESRHAPGERFYRTGDLVHWNGAGQLEYHRRADRQVKIHGLRLELAEVEAVLAACPGVRQAAAIVREDRPGSPYLAAYVSGSSLDTAGLRAHCESHLARPTVPSRFAILPELPRNPSGKVDYASLPMPPESAPDTANPEPGNLLERELAAIWAQALELESVSPGDGFFELGGHSLTAARLLTEVEHRFGVLVPMVNLLTAPSPREFARLIAGAEQVRPWSSIVPLQASGTATPLFFASRLHALSGRHLADHLGHGQPVYGLEPPGMDGGSAPLTRVEDLAAHYVRSMRNVQPKGPYRLAGHSFGGYIVFEMARQLEKMGLEVELLALLDCSAYALPAFRRSRPAAHTGARRAWYAARRLTFAAGAIWDSGRRNSAADVVALGTRRIERLVNGVRQFDRAYGHHADRVGSAQLTAMATYTPEPIRAPITLVRARLHGPRFDDRFGWQHLTTGAVTVHDVEAGHVSMMRPPLVGQIARILRPLLDRSAGHDLGKVRHLRELRQHPVE